MKQPTKNKKPLWKGQRESYQEALNYLSGRMNGSIRSFKTPWAKVNDAGVAGFEWHSMVVIGGRPGTGKTLIKDQIIREAFKLNPGENIRALEFQFEMLARVTKVREFSSVLGKSYKYVCSAGGIDKVNNLTKVDIQKCFEYSKNCVENPVDVVEKPCTVDVFANTIKQYMEIHAVVDPESNNKVYKNTLITVDHSYLFQIGSKENGKTDMLYNLGETCTSLKKQYPIIFIILSQLNPKTEKPDRNEDGKYGNYVLESDLHGGDALIQHADIVFGINRPAVRFIKFYGPDRFIIEDDSVLVFHFLKVRNGDVRISFFKAEYDKMRVIEMNTPGTQQRKVSTKVN